MKKKQHFNRKGWTILVLAAVICLMSHSVCFSQETLFEYQTGDLGIQLSKDVELDNFSNLNSNTFNLRTQWSGTILNTSYYCQDNQIEFGISTETINKLLPGNIKMELKTKPHKRSTAIVFSIEM